MQRRDVLKAAAIAGAELSLRRCFALAQQARFSTPTFTTADASWQHAYDKALGILAANVQILPDCPGPVLIEGSQYAGIWQECAPQEGLIYRHFRPDAARNNHLAFFRTQHSDGQLPANIKRMAIGFGQIQMVVPIAATAWELAEATGDDELLQTAYAACSRWDDWLMKFRNTRGTGLIEGFCTYDTGMDNSPRWAGKRPQCPEGNAKLCPHDPTLPRLCPDLSATTYGGRIALAAMARALGRDSDADRWTEQAETLRSLILKRLYVPEDAAFYDLDAQNHFVKINCCTLCRVCGEHIPDTQLFQTLWERQLSNTSAFWAPYPFPSVALNDPLFVRTLQHNSWGGPSQALTALRAPRWMSFYGKHAELAHLMQQWCDAILRDATFRQQINPRTGVFTNGDLPRYSPCALLLLDFTWRLAGVIEERDELHWNIRPGCAAAKDATFHASSHRGRSVVAMHYRAAQAELTLNGRSVATVEGTARLITDRHGKLLSLTGIDRAPQRIILHLPGKPTRSLLLAPNSTLAL